MSSYHRLLYIIKLDIGGTDKAVIMLLNGNICRLLKREKLYLYSLFSLTICEAFDFIMCWIPFVAPGFKSFGITPRSFFFKNNHTRVSDWTSQIANEYIPEQLPGNICRYLYKLYDSICIYVLHIHTSIEGEGASFGVCRDWIN